MNASNRILRRAVCISILLHVVILLSSSKDLPFGRPVFSVKDRIIGARLSSSSSGAPNSQVRSVPGSPIPVTDFTTDATKAVPKTKAGKEAPVLPSVSPSSVADEIAVSDKSFVVSGEPTTSSALATLDAVSPDGLRQYRLNLAREARRFKRYPALARQRGWEGVVVVVVNMLPGGATPHVSLSQSSGFDLLDQEALELVLLAVHNAVVPDNLRNRLFGLTLPIHYRLDD